MLARKAVALPRLCPGLEGRQGAKGQAQERRAEKGEPRRASREGRAEKGEPRKASRKERAEKGEPKRASRKERDAQGLALPRASNPLNNTCVLCITDASGVRPP